MRQAGVTQQASCDLLVVEAKLPACGGGEGGVLRIVGAAQGARAGKAADLLGLCLLYTSRCV